MLVISFKAMRLLWSNIEEQGKIERMVVDLRVVSHSPVEVEGGVLV